MCNMLVLLSVLLLCVSGVWSKQDLGVWYFVANGASTHTNHIDPTWLSSSVSLVSLAFISPAEIHSNGLQALPQAFINHAQSLRANNIPVMFSIGGAAFAQSWTFLDSAQDAKAAAQVAANWSLTYDVGIEIDYEGSGDFSVSGGVVRVAPQLANLGVFIEEFRSIVPMGKQLLTLDVYAAQGGGPGLTYLINSYLDGQPTTNPKWVKSGDDRLLQPALDFINIMVAGGDDSASIKSYIEGYVGPNAAVATEWNTERINAPVSAERAMISMIASNHCGASLDSGLSDVINYIQSTNKLRGIMLWAVAPFGCPGDDYDPVLKIGDWDCSFNTACPALSEAKSRLSNAAKVAEF